MIDIYSFAYGRTRENIVPRHQRQVLIQGQQNHIPDVVGLLALSQDRLNKAAALRCTAPAADRDR